MEFKDILKNRRTQLGLTLEEIGNQMGVSKATVQRWESGEIKNIRRDKIIKLADILDTTPALLMGWEINLPEGVENNPGKLTQNYEENLQYLKNHEEDDLVELYKKIKTDKNLVMLVDKACQLEPQDVEQLLRIIDTFKKETIEKINNTKKYD